MPVPTAQAATMTSVPPASTLGGRVLLALALASGIALLTPLWTAGPLGLDEHVSYWMIRGDVPATVWRRTLEYGAVPPLSSWVEGVTLTLLGTSETAFRLPSAVAYLLAIAAVYQAGKRAGDSLVGGWAALILAWHPDVVDEVRIARPYGLLVLLASLLLWAALAWAAEPRSWRRAVGWGTVAAAVLWTHYTAWLVVAVTAAWMAWRVRRSKTRMTGWAAWLAAVAIPALAASPLLGAVFRLSEWSPFLNFGGASTPPWQVIGPIWWVGVPLGVGVAWFTTRLDKDVWRRLAGESGDLFFLALLPLMVLAYLASDELSSLGNPRYRIAAVPAGACCLALLIRSAPRPAFSTAACVATLGVAWLLAPQPPWRLGHLGHVGDANWAEAARVIDGTAAPREPVFVQSGLVETRLLPAFVRDPLFQEYTACRLGTFYLPSKRPRYGLPLDWDAVPGTRTYYDDLLKPKGSLSVRSFWLVAATDTDLVRGSLEGMRQIAERRGYRREETRTWPNLVAERYLRVP